MAAVPATARAIVAATVPMDDSPVPEFAAVAPSVEAVAADFQVRPDSNPSDLHTLPAGVRLASGTSSSAK